MSDKKVPADTPADVSIGRGVIPGILPKAASDQPMTELQAAELRKLTDRAGEPFDGNLTRAQAQERIEALRAGS